MTRKKKTIAIPLIGAAQVILSLSATYQVLRYRIIAAPFILPFKVGALVTAAVILAVGYGLCGLGLLLYKNWARILSIIFNNTLFMVSLYIFLTDLVRVTCNFRIFDLKMIGYFIPQLAVLATFILVFYYLTSKNIRKQFK